MTNSMYYRLAALVERQPNENFSLEEKLAIVYGLLQFSLAKHDMNDDHFPDRIDAILDRLKLKADLKPFDLVRKV